jgi:hypothetical protein
VGDGGRGDETVGRVAVEVLELDRAQRNVPGERQRDDQVRPSLDRPTEWNRLDPIREADLDSPNSKAVHPDKGRLLVVAWKAGGESVVDVAGPIGAFAVLAPLRDDDGAFRNVQVGEWGWSIHWSDDKGRSKDLGRSKDMELAADTLRRLALEQDVEWLRRWRASHGMTQAEAAVAVGLSPRTWRAYEAGSLLLPKTVRLACVGLDAQAAAGAAA